MTHHAWEGAPPPAAPGPPGPPAREAPTALAVAAAVLAVVVALLQVATAVAAVPAAGDLRDVLENGGSAGLFSWYTALAVLILPVLVASYVVTCLWLQQARSNAEAIRPVVRHRRGSIWVWLGWWVPIVSLWFPLQVVRDVAEGSATTGRRPGLGLWWTGWLVWLFANRASAQVVGSSDPEVVGSLPVVEGIGTLALVVACVQWCRLVRWITTEQKAALGS